MVLAVRVGHGFRVPCSFRDPNPAGCGPECSGSGPIPASGPGVPGWRGPECLRTRKRYYCGTTTATTNYNYDYRNMGTLHVPAYSIQAA